VSKRLCVFCDQEGVTKEHAWPLWLSKIIPDCGSTHIIQSEKVSGNRSYHSNLYNPTVRIVCSTCNSGWLSRLEQDSMKLLEDLIRGYHRQLEVDDQRLLSLWCVKTGIILDRITRPSTIPSIHGCSIFKNRCPSDYTKIWLTSYMITEPVMSHFLQPLSLEIEGNVFSAYLQTFHIGAFSAQILWSESQLAVNSVASYPDSLAHTNIWPLNNSAVEWPKTKITTLEEREIFKRRIITHPYKSATTVWDNKSKTITNIDYRE
jgi:hypothetical protein